MVLATSNFTRAKKQELVGAFMFVILALVYLSTYIGKYRSVAKSLLHFN